MSDASSSTELVDWQAVLAWAFDLGESMAYWDEVTVNHERHEERERRHRDALAAYNRWQVDRKRRLAEYDARVDAYYAALDEARARVEARDRAEYAEYCRRVSPQHDAHVRAYYASRTSQAAE